MPSHIPVNHPLRFLYRTVAALAGAYVLAFGILAMIKTGVGDLFARHDLPSVLGLHSNGAFSILSMVVGTMILGGALIGGNLDRWINLAGGVVFLLAGLVMIAVLQTDANFLGFTVATCVVSFVIGLVLFCAGLYGKVGSRQERRMEEGFRRGGPDPYQHDWAFKGGPKPAHQTDDHRFA